MKSFKSVNAIYFRFLKAKYKKRLKHQKRYLKLILLEDRPDWSFSLNPHLYLKLKEKFDRNTTRSSYDIVNNCFLWLLQIN